MMRRITIVAAAGLLGASLIAGCGGGKTAPTGSTPGAATTVDPKTTPYCALLKASAKDISSLATFDFSKFGALADDARKIRDKVPAALVQPWTTLGDAVIGMDDALDAAGTNLKALIQAVGSGQAPHGVSADQLAGLNAKLAALQGSDVGAAAGTIKAHAQTACHVTLS